VQAPIRAARVRIHSPSPVCSSHRIHAGHTSAQEGKEVQVQRSEKRRENRQEIERQLKEVKEMHADVRRVEL